jgi:hypothetical protein
VIEHYRKDCDAIQPEESFGHGEFLWCIDYGNAAGSPDPAARKKPKRLAGVPFTPGKPEMAIFCFILAES